MNGHARTSRTLTAECGVRTHCGTLQFDDSASRSSLVVHTYNASDDTFIKSWLQYKANSTYRVLPSVLHDSQVMGKKRRCLRYGQGSWWCALARSLGAVTTAAAAVACVRLARSLARSSVGRAAQEREREKGSRPFADQNSLPLLLVLRRRRRHRRHGARPAAIS